MIHNLKALPEEERPRERMVRDGIDALSLAELIAIVLGSGVRGKSVLHLSQEILSHFGGLEPLLEASIAELMHIKGIGKAKAMQLKAVFGIAAKSRQLGSSSQNGIASASEAYAIAREKIGFISQEALLVLLRDVRGNLIRTECVSLGTLSEVLIHPREVFYPAVRHKAHSLIVAHNHPSGDPTPSKSDVALTKSLLACSHVMSIRLDDHLIVCKERYVSFREIGCVPFIERSKY